MEAALITFIIATAVVFISGPMLITLLALLFFVTYPRDANDIEIDDRKDHPVAPKLHSKNNLKRRGRFQRPNRP
jgi:hypothetical protein